MKFADNTSVTQQHAGFKTKKEANVGRDEVVGQLHHGTYIVYGKIKVADFMEYWLEDVMRKRIADNTYNSYKNAVYNYISPGIGKMYMSTLNQGYIRKLYNSVTDQSENVARLVKTVMNTAMEYAKAKNVIAVNCAEGVMLPKKAKKKDYRILFLKPYWSNGGFMRKTAGAENGSSGIWIISAVRLMGIREAKATIKNIIKSY